uniref:L-ornithine N(5)-oxygenase n=1 Tax=Onchocerca volvulus TaxID=6282 RepID=A0A8R1XVJ6_ONCVO
MEQSVRTHHIRKTWCIRTVYWNLKALNLRRTKVLTMRNSHLPCHCKTTSLMCNDSPSTSPVSKLDTEVIIVGNGPAGLSLSAFLSGWLPFYSPNDGPHPNHLIHEKLVEHKEESLLDQDLSWLDNSINVMNNGARPLSLLYDTLVRPNADTGTLDRSKLCWIYDRNRAIPHLVVAETPVGGSWNNYDDDMISVSVGSFLDLPAFLVADWCGENKSYNRLPTPLYRRYLSDYARRVYKNKNIICGLKVTHIEKCSNSCMEEFWEVRGVKNGESVLLKCKKIVLACGKNQDRLLGVKGELEENRIVYNLRDLKQLLTQPNTKFSKEKVVVVGDGVSAADSILHCLASCIPVLHVIRRSDKQLRFVQLSRLSPSIYPEYSKIFKLMMGYVKDYYYTKVTCASIESLNNGTVRIKSPQGIFTEHFRVLCVCTGKQSDLSMLTDKYTFQDYYCNEDPSLFRIGSLAGDHFVRYLVGGAMDVARCLM